MAQADDGQGAYTLVTADNETKQSSQDYSGKGTANYPNNDIYKGDFFNVFVMAQVNIHTTLELMKALMMVFTTVHGIKTLDTVLANKLTPELEHTTVTGRVVIATVKA